MSVFKKLRGTTSAKFALGVTEDNDEDVFVDRDGSGKVRMADKQHAVPVPLVDLVGLLETDPSTPGNAYANTIVGGKVTQERWTRTVGGTLIKVIDYTYVVGTSRVSTEVRKVYDVNGTTIIAQVTMTYTYTGSQVTGVSTVRDV